jgi:hypothetical protein
MRLPAKLLAVTVALLVFAQVFAVFGESQFAAIGSWYLIYALVILVPLTLLDEGFDRFYRKNAS